LFSTSVHRRARDQLAILSQPGRCRISYDKALFTICHMLGYRKRSFGHAHALLRRLRLNLEDLDVLRELQKLLLRELMRAEEKIRQLKSEVGRITNAEDAAAVKRVEYLNNRIAGLRQCAYIWRCFGDAIAFLYLDRFSLKQCFYSTETTHPKQDAGFISGKEGLANELALLERALENGVPALLVDLTNTIRHGDVCLLGGPDPYLIEVKSAKKVNSRGRKQKRSIEKLHTLYETDECNGLRGFPKLQRRSNRTPEQTHIDVINDCIREAVNDGYAIRHPEHGVSYLVLTEAGPVEEAMKMLGLKNAVWLFFLNQHKADRTWAPYFPFVLSIDDADYLWDFIRGSLSIFVVLELDALCKIASNEGCESVFDSDNAEYSLRIKTPDRGEMNISSHMLTRIGLEFVSPQWIVRCSLERLGIEGS
jgi:hypothetical protein